MHNLSVPISITYCEYCTWFVHDMGFLTNYCSKKVTTVSFTLVTLVQVNFQQKRFLFHFKTSGNFGDAWSMPDEAGCLTGRPMSPAASPTRSKQLGSRWWRFCCFLFVGEKWFWRNMVIQGMATSNLDIFDARHTCPPLKLTPVSPKKTCFFCASATAQTIDATIFILVTTKAGNKSGCSMPMTGCLWEIVTQKRCLPGTLFSGIFFCWGIALSILSVSPNVSPKHATGQADIFSSKSIEKKCHA